MPIKKVIDSRFPVKIWTDDIDDASIAQLRNIGNMPFIHGGVHLVGGSGHYFYRCQ